MIHLQAAGNSFQDWIGAETGMLSATFARQLAADRCLYESVRAVATADAARAHAAWKTPTSTIDPDQVALEFDTEYIAPKMHSARSNAQVLTEAAPSKGNAAADGARDARRSRAANATMRAREVGAARRDAGAGVCSVLPSRGALQRRRAARQRLTTARQLPSRRGAIRLRCQRPQGSVLCAQIKHINCAQPFTVLFVTY